ncbi:hypothetical protein CNY89_30740, partial [Amaricoccus sp. HAR-UPW-R2A-40]
ARLLGGDETVFRNLPSGSLIPIRVARVLASGTMAARLLGGDETVFRNLPSGSLIPIRVARVLASGT